MLACEGVSDQTLFQSNTKGFSDEEFLLVSRYVNSKTILTDGF